MSRPATWCARAPPRDWPPCSPRVDACFEAGALATGCSVRYEELSPVYSHMEAEPALLAGLPGQRRGAGPADFEADDDGAPRPTFSTDMANVSLAVPTIHPLIGIETHGAVNHQHEFAAACITPSADKAVPVTEPWRWPGPPSSAATDPALRARLLRRVITEHTLLEVNPGREAAFVEAMEGAKAIIAAGPGLGVAGGRALRGAAEAAFLLLVEWERLGGPHRGLPGVGGVPGLGSAALHHFYDPFPVVEHFEAVVTA